MNKYNVKVLKDQKKSFNYYYYFVEWDILNCEDKKERF